MIILEDSGQKIGKHAWKNKVWAKSGIEVMRVPLPVGDYILMNDKVEDVVRRKEHRGIPVKKMDLLGTFDVSVDTKKDIPELIGNVCGQEHDRFRDELILAQNNGIQLYVVVENKGEYIPRTDVWNAAVTDIEKLNDWKNPRRYIWKKSQEVFDYWPNGKPKYKMVQAYPRATSGKTLYKALKTIEEKYGCKFIFCLPQDSPKVVIDLLTGERDV